MKVTLLLPTLNEIEGMKEIMPRIKREWVDEIVFIDGCSTDGTRDYIKEHGYDLISEKRPGEGARSVLAEAIERLTGDVIITFSPDGNCIPELIPSLIDKMEEGYDMVVASRYLPGAKSVDDTPITAFGNWLFTKLTNVFYKGAYTDVLNIYRAYKKELIKNLDLDKDASYALCEKIFHTKLGWELLLSIRAAKKKLKIGEIAGDEPPRIGGKTKLKIFKWGSAYFLQLIREIFVWRR